MNNHHVDASFAAKLKSQAWSAAATSIRDSLRELLESSHLYQHVEVDIPRPPEDADDRSEDWSKVVAEQLITQPWNPTDSDETWRDHVPEEPNRFLVPDAALFCDNCKRSEAHNLASVSTDSSLVYCRGPAATWLLVYLCQRCKEKPLCFLVTRNSRRLSITGRSPIENIELPPAFPKAIRHHLRSALILRNANQVLPALFMLRVAIEQWAASKCPADERRTGDELMSSYKALLRSDFNSSAHSLSPVYEVLSAKIHAAEACVETFEEQWNQVLSHFRSMAAFAAGPHESAFRA